MIVNWIIVLNDQLLAYGLSLHTTEAILEARKVEFNQVLRDVHQKFPTKQISHMILAMEQYYAIEFVVSLLDEELLLTVKEEKARENSATLRSKKGKDIV